MEPSILKRCTSQMSLEICPTKLPNHFENLYEAIFLRINWELLHFINWLLMLIHVLRSFFFLHYINDFAVVPQKTPLHWENFYIEHLLHSMSTTLIDGLNSVIMTNFRRCAARTYPGNKMLCEELNVYVTLNKRNYIAFVLVC